MFLQPGKLDRSLKTDSYVFMELGILISYLFMVHIRKVHSIYFDNLITNLKGVNPYFSIDAELIHILTRFGGERERERDFI